MTNPAAARMLEQVRRLAAPDLAGRKPGHYGGDQTVAYLEAQLKEAGVAPGWQGGYRHPVGVWGATATSEPRLTLHAPGESVDLASPSDFVVRSWGTSDACQAEAVFIGFGIDAPEREWNDFDDDRLAGKFLIVLPGEPSRWDGGSTGTSYHARWTRKAELARRVGAAGVLIVHGPAVGYPFPIIQTQFAGEQFALLASVPSSVDGWLTSESGARLLKLAGHDIVELTQAASTTGFRPVHLGVEVAVRLENRTREFIASNVIGEIRGTDHLVERESLLVAAHWDHLGPVAEEDPTMGYYPGAVDNATGVASVLEIARAIAAAPLRRRVRFVLTTLEESGLLGSAALADDLATEMADVLAIVNLDQMNVWGRSRDLVNSGYGHSSIDEVLERRVREAGRVMRPDPEPERAYFYRSDHLEFMKRGVPALFLAHPFSDHVLGGAEFSARTRSEYAADFYHQKTDLPGDDWDLSGMVDDVALLIAVIRDIAEADEYPRWKAGSEFNSAWTTAPSRSI